MKRGVTVVLAVILASMSAFARAASRVALVRPSASTSPTADPTLVRLRAELESAGFEVVEVEPRAGDPRERTEQSAAGDRVFATLEVVSGTGSSAADVWVADHVTGKTVVRRVSVAADDPAPATTLAVRAVELLRASLLEAGGESAGPKPTETPVPEDVARWMAPREKPRFERLVRGFALDAGIALLHAPDLGPAVGPSLRGWFALADAWSIRAAILGPFFVADVEGTPAVGRASTRQEAATAEIAFHPTLRATRFIVPIAAMGLGAYHLHAKGQVNPPYIAKSDDAWAALFVASAGVALRASEHVAFIVDVQGALATPKPTVRMLGVEIAEAGRPSLVARTGLFATF